MSWVKFLKDYSDPWDENKLFWDKHANKIKAITEIQMRDDDGLDQSCNGEIEGSSWILDIFWRQSHQYFVNGLYVACNRKRFQND